MIRLPESLDLPYAAPAAEIAVRAGELVRDFYYRGVATEYKGDVDLVTEADRSSENLIVEGLAAAFPDHGIFGEEGTRDGMHREYRWYIDPLDGTTNFAHRFPVFCVSLGLEYRGLEHRGLERRGLQDRDLEPRPGNLPEGQDGELVAGVIYDPMRDELFVTEKGKGAFRNGQRIHVSKTADLGEGLIATGFPSRKRHEDVNIHFYQEFTLRSHGVRRCGSAALDLAYTACGRFDGYWEFNLNPWDTSAGALLVAEAGGSITRFDGAPFLLDSREILATNGLLKSEMVALFEDMFAGRNLNPIPTPAEFAARRTAKAAAE